VKFLRQTRGGNLVASGEVGDARSLRSRLEALAKSLWAQLGAGDGGTLPPHLRPRRRRLFSMDPVGRAFRRSPIMPGSEAIRTGTDPSGQRYDRAPGQAKSRCPAIRWTSPRIFRNLARRLWAGKVLQELSKIAATRSRGRASTETESRVAALVARGRRSKLAFSDVRDGEPRIKPCPAHLPEARREIAHRTAVQLLSEEAAWPASARRLPIRSMAARCTGTNLGLQRPHFN